MPRRRMCLQKKIATAPGRRMGHVGGIITGGEGTAADKMAALEIGRRDCQILRKSTCPNHAGLAQPAAELANRLLNTFVVADSATRRSTLYSYYAQANRMP